MLRRWKTLGPVVLVILMMAGCDSCDDPVLPAFPNSLVFNPGSVTLNVGDSKTVTPTVAFGNSSSDPGTTVYESANPALATVDAASGAITCVSVGTTTITATNTNKGGKNKATLTVNCTTPLVLGVTPTTVPFSHTVGTTTCPQKIGTLHIATNRNEPVNVTIAPVGTFITVASPAVVVPALGAVDVDVNFNCTTTGSFTTTIVVTGTTATGASDTKTITVTATIK